jgi:hypothetical protein
MRETGRRPDTGGGPGITCRTGVSSRRRGSEVVAVMHMLLWLPRLFRYFGWFQAIVGFVRPLWPRLSRMLPGRVPAAAPAA